MASQLSDTDGGDANLLSTPELLAKCKSVITKDNPTGQPPGSVQTGPTMLNLLTRYQTYATIVKGTAVRAPVQQQVSKPRSGFASFPPGRDAASAHKAVAAKVKAATASPKVTKSAVKSTGGNQATSDDQEVHQTVRRPDGSGTGGGNESTFTILSSGQIREFQQWTAKVRIASFRQ
jgi:hypothetical protein